MSLDPVTMLVAATATQAVGSVYSGYAQGAQADAAANAAAQNAEIARQQSAVRETEIRRHNARTLGVQRAAAAQSGFDPNAGSLLALQADSAGAAEQDALTARYEGGLQALSFDGEAASARQSARFARRTGWLNAAGSLVGNAPEYGRLMSQRPSRGDGMSQGDRRKIGVY